LRLILTAGQCHDSPQAKAVIEGYAAQVLMGDKGYDDGKLVETVEAKGMQAVIPPRANRKQQREDRHLVECFINKIKHYRRLFSRFEKLSKYYLGFLSFVSALIWLR
jgi:transposase